MQQRKYRLLKDLPGCPANGETKFFNETQENRRPNGNTYYVCSWLGGYLEQDKGVVENYPDFFQSVTEPERPYPWEPKEGETFWISDPMEMTPSMLENDASSVDRILIERYGAYRTGDDARLRFKAEPLVNRAVQALLNKRLWKREDANVWRITENSQAVYEPHLSWVGCQVRDSGFFQSKEDAQAICDLFNFFLSNPHE